ncbi:MAG: hypothetical protein HOK41_14540 [Nitrospina sp.]|nr:hypothetical protein [Nitrospina sp.]MBT6718635.1 hypothetical protein [Nitrospina sp.]
MKIIKKPIDTVVKQLQSKRYHVKTQDNKKAYSRGRAKKEFRSVLKDSVGKEVKHLQSLAA